jgi:3-hydroxyisobutyrate dehydrogenase
MSKPRVAFLGLGIMGGGMAGRLLGAGFPLTVYNRNAQKAEPLRAAGAQVAQSPRSAAADADVVISMVADDVASRALWLGDAGALAGVRRGAVLVECSTLTVAWVNELAKAAATVECELVDAPVTGSKQAAANAELNFLVGGTDSALEKVRPALTVMGRSVTHLGPTGSGALLKLINNFMAGVHVAACAEAMAWLERSGMDRNRALALLMEGAAGSAVTKVVAARMTAADFTPNFFLKLMAKDLGYAISEATAAGQSLKTATGALERFQEAIAAGHGDKDMAALVLPLRAAKK